MKIENNLLFNDDNTQVDFKLTPNKGGVCVPKYLVIHYTAVTHFQIHIKSFSKPCGESICAPANWA